jgi:hypothetical protein
MTSRGIPPHRIAELLHAPSQADPRKQRGPAQQEECNKTDDATEHHVTFAGGFQLGEFSLLISKIDCFRPPFALSQPSDRRRTKCVMTPAHPNQWFGVAANRAQDQSCRFQDRRSRIHGGEPPAGLRPSQPPQHCQFPIGFGFVNASFHSKRRRKTTAHAERS